MDFKEESNDLCPVASGLAHVGDAWSMLILRDASQGLSRFDQFRTNLNIAPNILTRRLAALVEHGLLERRRYCERPPRDEYVLTEAGREFLPILVLLGDWARRRPAGDRLNRFVDAETGQEIRPILMDANTGADLVGRPLNLVAPDSVKG
ncbi:winged helix-turn-helix transcriptional regulator [Bradyrhizobium pachyrhizi]|uniref:winged helix-turn-helix transcriptional regulator n=1 Tax=Bradyrhizobium pachyrhizi TaxID=280333 RepID=UPI00067C27C0|nr:helix-turn-helix domain-containing protein [Bradyrhizobium pachyrhizi]